MTEDLNQTTNIETEQENKENIAKMDADKPTKADIQEESTETKPESAIQQGKISDLEKVINHLNDKLLRSLAEADNLRKRNREELEKANKYAITNFASDLVLVVENFYLAVDNMPKEEIESNATIKHFAEAIIMTQKELTKVLEKNGIKRLYPLGEKFDHNYHQAITQIKSDQEEEGRVIKVIQAGYLINDRLIKPALVAVSCN